MNINSARSPNQPLTESSYGFPKIGPGRAGLGSHSLTQKLQSWGAKAVAALTQGKAPQISSVMTKQGPQLRVHDPVSNQTQIFATETEVRAWLEQRYYLD